MEKIYRKVSQKEMTEEEYFKQSFCRDSSIKNFDDLSLIEKLSLNITDNSKKIYFKKSDFEMLSEIGRGAYSKVYKARYLKDDSIKAIKIIEKDFMEKENKIYQVYLETEILTKINHPLIIKCYGLFTSGNKLYIVLEYIKNTDLSEFLKIHSKIFFNKIFFRNSLY